MSEKPNVENNIERGNLQYNQSYIKQLKHS